MGRIGQLDGQLMIMGGGIETWLQYKDGFTLHHFCAFELLNDPRGVACLADFQRRMIEAAVANGFGVINEGIHYRASRDWGTLIGFSRDELAEINHRGVALYREIARPYDRPSTPMLVGGAIGPRGDAYGTGRTPDADEAEEYHADQIATLKDAGVDLVTALTFSSVAEAIGITRAAVAAGVPIVVSFFVRRGGRLAGGETVQEAIAAVDAATGAAPAHYMINCTHPTEFAPALTEGEWTRRIGGFMPNAVAMETLSLCTLGHLEDGDPAELGDQMAALAARFPHVSVWGGCCGTDARHMAQITARVGAVRERGQTRTEATRAV